MHAVTRVRSEAIVQQGKQTSHEFVNKHKGKLLVNRVGEIV